MKKTLLLLLLMLVTASTVGASTPPAPEFTAPAKADEWQAVPAPEIYYWMDEDCVYVDILWPETTGNQVYTGEYIYYRQDYVSDEYYQVEAYTEADFPYMESEHAYVTIIVPARGKIPVAAPVITYWIEEDYVYVTIEWPETDGNQVYTGLYEYPRPEYGQPDEYYIVEAFTEESETYEESGHTIFEISVPAKEAEWQAVAAPVIETSMDAENVYVTITWPETTGKKVYTGQYEYPRPEYGQYDELYPVEAYTEADYPYMESEHMAYEIWVLAKDPEWIPVAAPVINYTVEEDYVYVEIEWPETTGEHIYYGEYEYPRYEYDYDVYIEAFTLEDYPYMESEHAAFDITIPAKEGGPDPYNEHNIGEWLVFFDKNDNEVWYNLTYENVWWNDDERQHFVNLYFDEEYEYCRVVPIDIATFGNYQKNGFDVKFYVMIDGKRYGPNEDMDPLDFGHAYGWDYGSIISNPLTQNDNCFTLKLGNLGGGTGTYIFKCDVEDGAPVLNALSYAAPRTGTGTYESSILATNKDGEIVSIGRKADLYCDEFGTGVVPFLFYSSDGLNTWTTGAETDMIEAAIGDPFAQRTYIGSNRFTVPAGFRYIIDRVNEELYIVDYNYYGPQLVSNTYLYVQQLDTLYDPIENTIFTVDKPTILKGDYQTYRARVDFKEEYAAQVSDVKMEFDLPYWSEFIENSVMVGSTLSDYSMTEIGDPFNPSMSIITVPVADPSQSVRLCATPNNDGYCNSKAFVIYNLNGDTFRRPIGNVSFYSSNASIYVTPVSSDSRITVYGIAAGGKTVKVYDGDVLIAETTCLANGSWRVICNLYQPVNPSVHPIHATIAVMDGEEIYTETVEVVYRLSAPQPNKVTMCFLDNEIVFDFINGTVSPSYYEVPNSGIFSTYFTFVANLKGTTTTVHNLKFKILDTKGNVITKNGNYMPSSNEWVCQVSYPDVNKLPITVGLSYDYVWEGVLCHYENKFTDKTNGVTPNVHPHVILTDPSGYVYEGVPSNRLQGVTATCYYKDPETGEAVLWDAEQYEQQNPLVTDERGNYRWDVPIGQWQVKYEKEDYETTYSDWLPVPPPQLDINIGMVQMREPVVIKAHAYPQAVELEFDKYMFPETLTTDNITVSVNGTPVSGTIELLNAEVDDPDAITSLRRSKGTGLTLASRVRFNADQPFNADKVTLRVRADVESYAGVQMASDYVAVLPLELEMQQIVVDSVVVVPFMGDRLLNVAVQPGAAAAGKTLTVRSVAPMIAPTDAEQYTLDGNGRAVVTVHGDLPGMTSLLFSIDGYDLTASTLVEVSMEIDVTVATPTASIASGSEVEKGTEVYLFCTTPGATIYYTLDGSCPCDATEARMTYDGTPIIINSDVTIMAIAVCDGMYDSEVATFTYHVPSSVLRGDVNGDGAVNIADVNKLIDYILRGLINSETMERGDVNGDNTINIGDINAVIQIILGPSTGAHATVNTADLLHLNDLSLAPGETGTLSVTVDNAPRYSALQCDIVLPDGLTLVNASTSGAYMLETGTVNDCTSRAMTYSMNLLPFASDNQPVLTLTVCADASLPDMSHVTLTDVVLADLNGVAWYACDCTAMVNNASGINELNGSCKQVASVRYYNVAGQEMTRPDGLTIQVTTYTDGTRSATRLIK